jgi:hypothetical protein
VHKHLQLHGDGPAHSLAALTPAPVVEHLKWDSDLDSLRQRADFQQFLDTLMPKKTEE